MMQSIGNHARIKSSTYMVSECFTCVVRNQPFEHAQLSRFSLLWPVLSTVSQPFNDCLCYVCWAMMLSTGLLIQQWRIQALSEAEIFPAFAHRFSLSSNHCRDMIEILLKRTWNRKLSIHLFLWSDERLAFHRPTLSTQLDMQCVAVYNRVNEKAMTRNRRK